MTLPPFRRVFDEAGEEAWERLRWERPDLLLAILEAERARKDARRPDVRLALPLARRRDRAAAATTNSGPGPAASSPSAGSTAATPGDGRASADPRPARRSGSGITGRAIRATRPTPEPEGARPA